MKSNLLRMPTTETISPRLQFSVPSLGFDESKGPPTLKFVFFELPLDSLPYRFPETAGFFITNCWVRGEGEFEQRILIKCGDEVVVDTPPRPFELEDAGSPYMAVTFVQGVEFRKAAEHEIEIYLGEELVLSYPIQICVAPQE